MIVGLNTDYAETEEGGSDARAPYASILNFNSHVLITVNGMYLIFL